MCNVVKSIFELFAHYIPLASLRLKSDKRAIICTSDKRYICSVTRFVNVFFIILSFP